MNEMHNKNEGFTLVELIIVVAIMGVLQKRDDWQAFDPVVIAGKHITKAREIPITGRNSCYKWGM